MGRRTNGLAPIKPEFNDGKSLLRRRKRVNRSPSREKVKMTVSSGTIALERTALEEVASVETVLARIVRAV